MEVTVLIRGHHGRALAVERVSENQPRVGARQSLHGNQQRGDGQSEPAPRWLQQPHQLQENLPYSWGSPERGNRLDDHVTWLLDLLEPSAGRVRQLVAEQSLTTEFYCGCSIGQSNSSLGLRARTLSRMAALDADLVFDVYGESAERELEYWLNVEPGP